MRGKDKCKILKQIRKRIAEENDIPYVVEECQHKGECKGTCPKCEADLRMLERELSLRHRVGKAVAIAGIAAGMMTVTTGCDLEDVGQLLKNLIGVEQPCDQLQGDVSYPIDEDGTLSGRVINIEDDHDKVMGELFPYDPDDMDWQTPGADLPDWDE